MKFKLLLSATISIVINCTATAQFCIPEEGIAFHSKAMNQINSRHVQWIKSTALEIGSGKMPLEEVEQKAKSLGAVYNWRNIDIESMIVLVFMQISIDARDDMRKLLLEMNETNKKKKAMRDAVSLMKKKQAEQKNKLKDEYNSRTQYDSLKKLLTPSAVITPASAPVSAVEWDDLLNSFRDNLDSMNEMGEMESLRLQMAMDRMSKMMTTLSNLLKKISKTQDDIIKNLK